MLTWKCVKSASWCLSVQTASFTASVEKKWTKTFILSGLISFFPGLPFFLGWFHVYFPNIICKIRKASDVIKYSMGRGKNRFVRSLVKYYSYFSVILSTRFEARTEAADGIILNWISDKKVVSHLHLNWGNTSAASGTQRGAWGWSIDERIGVKVTTWILRIIKQECPWLQW